MKKGEQIKFASVKLEDGSYAFKNTKTGEIGDARFTEVGQVSEGFQRCKFTDGNREGWFYFDLTGGIYKKAFDEARDIHEGFGVVRIGNRWFYFNSSTGALSGRLFGFDGAWEVTEGFGVVKIGDKFTYFNPSTGKLCKQKFDDAYSEINGGYVAVRIGDKWTYFNPSTNKLCEQRFDETDIPYRVGLAEVRIGEEWTYFVPSTGFVFSARFPHVLLYGDGITDNYSISDCFKEHPEEFNELPTGVFYDTDLVEECLDSVANAIKNICPKKGSSQEAERYAKEMYDLVSNKIEREKKNIELEEDNEKKIEIGDKTSKAIKDLKKNL